MKKQIVLKSIIATLVFAIISLILISTTQSIKDPVDPVNESFGKIAGFFISRFGDPDWIGIHPSAEAYRVSFLYENASMYVLFELKDGEWKWVGLWPYRKPVDLEARKKAIIEAIEEDERKKKFEKLNKELRINTL
jgi:hypothetical protein